MAQPTMRNQEQIMKQTSKASPKVNSDLRGRGVKLLRAIGDDMEYHITLEGKEYTRCGNQYFIRVKNSHNGPYPFWRVHHGKNVHTRIDAAIQDYEDAHAEALDMDAARDVIEAAPVVVSAAHADQLSFWGENDYAARRAIVEECHAEALQMNAKKITPLLTPEQNAAYIYQLDFFYQMNAVGRAAEIEGAHVAAIKLDAQMMQDAWDNSDEIGRLIELEYAHDEALAMDETIEANLLFLASPEMADCWQGHPETLKTKILQKAQGEAYKINEAYGNAASFDYLSSGGHNQLQLVAAAHTEALAMDVGFHVKEINAQFNKENAENMGLLHGMLHSAMDKMEQDDLNSEHAKALEINELVSLGADVPRFMLHLIIKRRAGGYAVRVSDVSPQVTFNPLAASFWEVKPSLTGRADADNEREIRSKMRQFMQEGDTVMSIGDAVAETMMFALGANWIEIVRRWEVRK